jgi:hypothetical protein
MFISDDGVNWSSIRVIAVFLCVFPVLVILTAWGYSSVKQGKLQEIPWNVCVLVFSLVGAGLTGKVTQSTFAEKTTEVKDPPVLEKQ